MVEIISVRFKSGGKAYYFNPNGLQVELGQRVIIETARGAEFGECVQTNTMVDEMTLVSPLRPVLRLATPEDERRVEENRKKEAKAFKICQQKIQDHGLEMKLVDVEYNFEGNKILFFFTAEGRVDFRELVKDLASVFRTRIELRQIGVRDEAKMLGGLGVCGRPLCCSQFLDDFRPVSIKMAKTQNLSLNPTKISGTCGRLMCCLQYEQETYEELVKQAPKMDSLVETPDGVGTVSQVNLLREQVKVRLDQAPDQPQCYRNCDICVIRSGKGKRPEGYELPEPGEKSQPRLKKTLPPSPAPEQKPEEAGEGRPRQRSRKPRGDKPAGGGRPAREGRPEEPEQKNGGEAVRGEGGQGSAPRKRHRPRHRKPRPVGGEGGGTPQKE